MIAPVSACTSPRSVSADRFISGWFSSGSVSVVRPVPPVTLGALPTAILVDRALGQILGAAAQFEHHRTLRRVHHRASSLVDAVGNDLPFDAGCTQHHRLVGREHPKPALVGAQVHRRLGELGPRRERNHRLGLAADHPDQIGAARADVVGQVVGHQQAGPPGLDGHGAVDVALAQRQRLPLRADREMAGVRVAEQSREHRRGIGLRMAHPHHVGLGGQQGDGSAIGQHGQPLDGRRMPAEKPGAAALEQEVQRERDVLGRLDPVVGQRLAVADLDADVGAVQPAKRLLVGHVVAEEHGGRRALLVAQDVEGLTLVGLDHRELQHRLALGDLGVPRLRARRAPSSAPRRRLPVRRCAHAVRCWPA